jgi:putative ABC transport system permease protein
VHGLRLALERLKLELPQLAMAIAVIALGVALAAGVLLANRALRERFDESIDALAGTADLQISAVSGGTLDEATIDQVRATSGVKAAAPLLIGTTFIRAAGVVRVRLIGVDLLDDESVRVYRRANAQADGLDDPLQFLNQPDSVLAPRSLVGRLHVERGERIDVEAPLGLQRLTVRGVLDDAGVARTAGGNLLVMDLYAAQTLLGAAGRVSQIDVVVADDRAIEEVRSVLRAALPSHLDVARVADRKEDLARTAASFQAMLDVIATMGLVLAALITSNRLSTIYQARLWEMGVLRALGTRPATLVRSLIAESASFSIAGVLIGLPLGLGFAQLIVQPVADTMSLNLQQVVTATWVAPRSLPLLAAAGAGIISGLVAALVPALRAARSSIVQVLATGRSRDAPPDVGANNIFRLGVVVAALTLLVLQSFFDAGALAGVTMAAVAVAGACAVVPALRLVSRPLAAVLGSAARIGVEDQSRVPSRAAGVAALLMVGVAVVIWIGSMSRSFESYVVQRLMLDRQADLVVDSAFNEIQVGGDDARLAEEILSRLRGIPGVRDVAAGVNAVTLRPETGIVAADPVRFRDAAFGRWPLEQGALPDALERVSRGEAVLVDATLVAQRHLAVGAPVRLTTPSGVLERPLAGITPTKFRSPAGDVMLSRELYKEYWRDGSISQAFVVLQPGASAAATTAAIQATLGQQQHLRVMTRAELEEWYAGGVRKAFSFLDVLAALTIVVVMLGTADALAANILERTREIGTMRALGLSRRDVAMQVLAQAGAIGLVGTVLAIGTGYAMSFAFVTGLIPSLTGWRLGFQATYGVAAVAVSVGLLACICGALLPATRAARMSPSEALRYE